MIQNTNGTIQKQDVHFCYACKKKHTPDDVRGWGWETKKIGKKKVYYCRMGIDCTGCGELHYNNGNSQSYIRDGKTVRLCQKWYKSSSPTMEQRIAGLSPEEVMSGVQYGNEMLPYFKGKSSNNYSDDHPKQVKELKEALKEV